MDAPPALEHPGAFIKITHYLESLGARVPRIIAEDVENGLVLLEDLGDQTMTQLLAQGSAEDALYELAVDALFDLQHSYRNRQSDFDLPAYDLQTATAEVDLLTHWYLPARLGRRLEQQELDTYRALWRQMYQALPALEPVLVHRDFHVDNLLLVDHRCAMLDYQDALIGSPAYDLVSLLEDARRDIDPLLKQRLKQQWLCRYPEPDDAFEAHLQFWAAQRHCKVAGIFVRLWLRDGKPVYLEHLPRVMTLLANSLDHPPINSLKVWLQQLLGDIRHDNFAGEASALISLTE